MNDSYSKANVTCLSELAAALADLQQLFFDLCEWCLNCFIVSSALLFSHFLLCFSNYSRRLEDFPTSPTSTAKQEFLYVGSRVSQNQNCPDYTPFIHLGLLSLICAFSQHLGLCLIWYFCVKLLLLVPNLKYIVNGSQLSQTGKWLQSGEDRRSIWVKYFNMLHSNDAGMQKIFLTGTSAKYFFHTKKPLIHLSAKIIAIHSFCHCSECSPVPWKLDLHGASLFYICPDILITWRKKKKEAQIPLWLVIVLSLCFRTVVKCNIAKSQALYSAQRGLKTNNAAVFKVGAIVINIPQHPATLHSMMVRSSHQLSKQISDLIRQPSTTCVCSCLPSISYRIKFTHL